MDFTLTEEQREFQQLLRSFVDREIIPVAREWEQTGRYPTEIVKGMADMGLFGVTVPESYGGLDLDPVSFALVFEEISRGWMGIAGILGSHSLACRMIAMHGTEEQKQAYLPALATGERRTGIGLTEPDAGTDLQGIRTTARRDGDHYVVNGTKIWITNARYADPLPVLVKTDPQASPAHKGMSILLIDADLPGFTVTKDIPKLGYKGTESCEILLDDVRVPADRLLGGVEGIGLKQALSALEWGRVNIAARSVGIAQRAHEEALGYARQRKAFGKHIAEFQAIQLKLATIATQVQAARLMAYWSADAVRQGRADAQTGMAKIFCSEVALEAAIDAMKIHGGYGYSTEFEVERLYRDAILMSIGEGTNDVLRTVVAKALVRGEVTV
ncbi:MULTISPECIES: acyl-CoA dehydrogenase family protein [unclassified Solwaraspora]|uniref:acyl-CoA dehydrogenase family protein n=1 Tax=unclassified Solwaraspora TaxID=2627926 RepID=UPI00248B2578|nr:MULTISPECIES: acyl-CoA dehydrogenase family protein [unclassified Solwaraspora]WBB98939.1 acyl-CoA dehydrogenase family protein [Solwaraspora sp. WMMA2059]WBC22508.1 acyl-CoA dehydrogenase family protein [Solwaraspora sp. WMMA2080]WJK35438.1 acyl-CoA dehydrogenase family protein [Solwaraspora sp. WMMA2065]WJK39569.1 acyl-CoA dehydrogenase family protein [Solwaraspora sp. WMMA2056]